MAIIVLCLTLRAESVELTEAPDVVSHMAYATVSEHTLYIQGGYKFITLEVKGLYRQFFSLDLTQSWSTSNPPWTEVSAADTPNYTQLTAGGHTMSVSEDNNTLTLWDIGFPSFFEMSYMYHINTHSWEVVTGLPPPNSTSRGFYQAATDPTTGRVYIPGRLANNSMLQYDFSTRSMTAVPMPLGVGATTWNHYSFIWNEVRGAFLLFGGEGTPSVGSYLYEFKPSSSTPWTPMLSKGTVPPHTADSCMVSAYQGTKVLMFGGHIFDQPLNQTTEGTLYILDVATMTWSQGPRSQSRNGMACAVSGDNMVVWGGFTTFNSTGMYEYPSVALLVYNIRSAQWTTLYEHSKLNEKPPSSEASEAAITGGSVVSTAVFATAIAALLFT
ncbi:MAG: hypothetical protein J3R72DRAFT_503797 [Linnemannia gamsii]|nr:MAG: hypothetical protein J3R72DRAFT_503797 [Linnemannia gamsii]